MVSEKGHELHNVPLINLQQQERLLLKEYKHDGPVSSLIFLDDSRIVSGGVDRKMFVVRFGPGTEGTKGIEEDTLHLTVRCKGMKIEGIRGKREQKILERLLSKTE